MCAGDEEGVRAVDPTPNGKASQVPLPPCVECPQAEAISQRQSADPCHRDAREMPLLEQVVAALKAELARGATLIGVAPLPEPPRPCSRSARCRGRWRRARELWAVAEGARLVLNDMGATSGSGKHAQNVHTYLTDPDVPDVRPLVAAQRLIHHAAMKKEDQLQLRWGLRLFRRAAELVRARRAFRLTGVTAARFLRKQEDEGYETGGALPRPYVPVVASLLAEPECGEPTVSMEEALVGTKGEFLLREALCLKEPSEATSILKEMNPRFSKVLGARREYIDYLHRPICRELWEFRPASEARGTLTLLSLIHI